MKYRVEKEEESRRKESIDLVSLDRMSSGQSNSTSEISQIHSHSRSLTHRQIIHTGIRQPSMLTMPSFLSAVWDYWTREDRSWILRWSECLSFVSCNVLVSIIIFFLSFCPSENVEHSSRSGHNRLKLGWWNWKPDCVPEELHDPEFSCLKEQTLCHFLHL